MKKRIVILAVLLLALTVIPLSVSAASSGFRSDHVIDRANLLSASQSGDLEQMAAQLSEQYRCGVYFIAVDSWRALNGNDVFDCADVIYTNYLPGYGPERDGILLLLSMQERDYALLAYGGAQNVFTDRAMTHMEDDFLSYFGDDNWSGGVKAYLKSTEKILQLAQEGTIITPGNDPIAQAEARTWKTLVVVAVPLLVAFIVCMVFKGQMNTVHGISAARYAEDSGLELMIREDVFTHVTRVRQKIESQSSSRSGGSSGHSTGHSSGHSGKF